MTARAATARAGFLFDLDGTLAQTEHLHFAAFQALLAEHDRSLDEATFVQHVSGRSNEDITAFLFPELGEAQRGEIAQDKERWFRKLAASAGVGTTPGAAEFLAWVRSRGIATAVVTNAPRENADLVIDVIGFAEAFDTVIIAPELPRGKPHPDPYLAALRALSLEPTQALAIEDSIAGIAAARAAGIDVVAVATPATAAVLAASGPTLTIGDLTDERIYALTRARLLHDEKRAPTRSR
ncbi:MAG: HAD-IA family hydrolase [Burkholderiales bacterium]|nr:HAD-IA family hydrolase [Burkholderiales bacterium]